MSVHLIVVDILICVGFIAGTILGVVFVRMFKHIGQEDSERK